MTPTSIPTSTPLTGMPLGAGELAAAGRYLRAVDAVMIMTIFCWHLTACYVVQAAVLATGLRVPGAESSAWLLTLTLWLLCCSAVCAALVAGCRRFERSRPAGAGAAHAAAMGILCAAVGLFVLSRVGLDGLVDGRPWTSAGSLLLVTGGYRLLGDSARTRDAQTEACASVQL
ncbi:MAG TPA: hypothetical protein VL595_07985 [Pseudonocardia sp.]|nr:hypothetical protein [Pseudonocardia sp.]